MAAAKAIHESVPASERIVLDIEDDACHPN